MILHKPVSDTNYLPEDHRNWMKYFINERQLRVAKTHVYHNLAELNLHNTKMPVEKEIESDDSTIVQLLQND